MRGRPAVPRSVQPVERVAAVGEELLAGAEVAAALQAAVVGVEAVGDDEVAATRDFGPVGQVVVVGVAVVEEAADLDHQAARVRAGAAGVPADGPAADQPRDGFDVVAHVGALEVFRHELVVDPALSVAGDFEAAAGDRGGDLGVTLQCHADGVDRGRSARVREHAQDFPRA